MLLIAIKCREVVILSNAKNLAKYVAKSQRGILRRYALSG